MSRQWFVNGETMVYVVGRSDSVIPNNGAGPGPAGQWELGLSKEVITITPTFNHEDITLDAWGNRSPAEIQYMLSEVDVSMTLINYDNAVLDVLTALAMGGNTGLVAGVMNRAGTLMGGNAARFAPGNNYVTLYLSSPIGQRPWRFFYTLLARTPYRYPLGTEKSVVTLNMRCIPFTLDPYNWPQTQQGYGLGAQNYPLFDHNINAL